jgi:hypothetical protein
VVRKAKTNEVAHGNITFYKTPINWFILMVNTELCIIVANGASADHRLPGVRVLLLSVASQVWHTGA